MLRADNYRSKNSCDLFRLATKMFNLAFRADVEREKDP